MKGKIMLVLLLAAVLLVGCGKTEAETETVRYDAQETFSQDQIYDIMVFLPPDVTAEARTASETKRMYTHKGGDYSFYTNVFLASSAESALHMVTGKPAEELTVIETERFGLPEYRFAWYEQELGTNCRADIVQDGERYYAVVFSVEEDAGSDYNELIAEVFSTIGLNATEKSG